MVGDDDRFDITIPRDRPHLTFGGGAHYCIGAATARAELAESLTALSGRLAPPTINGPVIWRPPTALSGPDTLPLRFTHR